MPERKKLDWKKFVSKRIAATRIALGTREDVAAELALHLEESYEQARSTGLTHRAAVRLTLQEIGDWHDLTDHLCQAKQEDAMNRRTRTLWLPGIAILFAVGLVLLFLDRAALLQRLIWLACMAMLFGAAASETNRLNQRTKSFWLPGFISLTAAASCLSAADILHDPSRLFREITLHPEGVLRMSSGASHSFYFVWLSAQVALGALGAFFSRRAGGTRAARIVAGAFPAIAIVGTYVALMPFTSMFSGGVATAPLPVYIGSAILVWIVAPAIALLLGAAPFLWESSGRQTSQLC